MKMFLRHNVVVFKITRSLQVGFLMLLGFVAALGDGLTTLHGLRNGSAVEANPNTVALMGVIGVNGWLVFSIVFTMLVAGIGSVIVYTQTQNVFLRLILAACVTLCLYKIIITVNNLLIINTAVY